MDIDYLYKLLKLSKITLIGYNYANEHIKDEIISKLPSIKIDRLYDFSEKIIRDIKINSVLDNVRVPEYIIVDFDDIFLKKKIDSKYHNFENYSEYFKYLISNISDKIGNIKVIATSSTYKGLQSSFEYEFSCGASMLYLSDIAINITSEKKPQLIIIKNRYQSNHDNIKLDNLKEYNYICDYENIK